MAKKLYEESNIQAIADAIREKNGTTDTYKVSEMASAIEEIEAGGGSGINPEWTNWKYFSCNNNRNDLVEKLKFSDTSNGTDFTSMFSSCSKLTTIPLIDISKGKTFDSMFYNCTGLTTIPQLDYSSGTSFHQLFNGCSKLTTIPQLNTSNGTKFTYMFYGCSELTTIPQLDVSGGTDFSYMFNGCSKLTEIPELDTSNSNTFYAMFYNCYALTTIPLLDVSKAKTGSYSLSGLFSGCRELVNVTFAGTFPITSNLSVFSSSSKLTVDSLMSFINALSDNSGLSTTYTVTIGSTNLAKLTPEQIAIATNKNIILA